MHNLKRKQTRLAIMHFCAKYCTLSILFCMLAWPACSEPTTNNTLPPFGHTVFCAKHPRDCNFKRSENISGVSLASRLRQLNLIQQWVNNAIAPRPADPALFNAWSILPREGNCTDYAVSKRHILLEAGWPSASLLLAEVRLIASGEHHLILIVKDGSGDWVLDNLRPFIVRLPVIYPDYTWERVQSINDPRRWTKSFGGLG